MTINAAEIWGVADQIGSLEKGKWADSVLTDGDPLEVRTNVKKLYIKGHEVTSPTSTPASTRSTSTVPNDSRAELRYTVS